MQTMNQSSPLLVSPRDAAKLLAVSQRKLWSMTFEQRPGLPYVRTGRLVRYSLADLRGWIDAQRQGGQS